MRVVGVFGGTFDPPHFGHLRTAVEIYQDLDLAEVRLIPCRQPPHRPEPSASPAQRLAMLVAAVGDQPGLLIDERELLRPGPSYMVDTLASLRAELGPTPLALIVGWDAFAGLDSWHKWREIFELAHLIIVKRPTADLTPGDELAMLLNSRRVDRSAQLESQPAGLILVHVITQMDISASAIRALVARGKSARYLTPDSVCGYIEQQRLYQQ